MPKDLALRGDTIDHDHSNKKKGVARHPNQYIVQHDRYQQSCMRSSMCFLVSS